MSQRGRNISVAEVKSIRGHEVAAPLLQRGRNVFATEGVIAISVCKFVVVDSIGTQLDNRGEPAGPLLHTDDAAKCSIRRVLRPCEILYDADTAIYDRGLAQIRHRVGT